MTLFAGSRRLALLSVLSALALGGCGGGGDATTSYPGGIAPPGAGPSGGQFDALANCLKEHGFNLPRPPAGGRPPGGPAGGGAPPFAGQNAAKARKAFQACSRYAPGGGVPPGP